MRTPIIIYGKTGQLATALAKLLGNSAIVIASTEADFSIYQNIVTKLKDLAPRAIINATAYTNVDLAQSHEDEAHRANVLIPAALAQYAKQQNIPFVHYSTDYVFAGNGDQPHKENDPTVPLNIYGKTKLEGEQEVVKIGGQYLILRTSWVYAAGHKNFLTTMLRLGKEKTELSVVCDQIGAPTYATDLAAATINILAKGNNFPVGIYHLCNQGQTSWYEYAQTIFALAKTKNFALAVTKVNPISSAQYPTPAVRPLNSRLDCTKAKSNLETSLPNWKISLETCLEEIVASNHNPPERLTNY